MRSVSIQELCESTSGVIARIEAGESLTLTIDRRAVAEIVPRVEAGDSWIPEAELRRLIDAGTVDPDLLDDLADVRGAEIRE